MGWHDMKRLLLAGVATATFFAGSAKAADVAVRPLVYRARPPVAAPILSWTGFYIGPCHEQTIPLPLGPVREDRTSSAVARRVPEC